MLRAALALVPGSMDQAAIDVAIWAGMEWGARDDALGEDGGREDGDGDGDGGGTG